MVDTPESLENLVEDAEEAVKESLDVEKLRAMQEKMEANLALVGFVDKQWQLAKDDRRETEDKWLQAFRDIRGRYNSTQRALIARLQQTNPQASSAFIKISKTKATAAYGQLTDVLFADGKVPISVEPTPVPEGVEDYVHVVAEGSPEAEMVADPLDRDWET